MIQDRRKELDLQFTDRIELWLLTDAEDLNLAIVEHRDYITSETLTRQLMDGEPPAGVEVIERMIGDHELKIGMRVSS